jgi:hypothetical protein
MSKEATNKEDTEGGNTCPSTEVELKKIEGLVEKQCAKEKRSAAHDGEITCTLTGRQECFCACGPHLLCSEHNLNRLMYWEGNYPDNLDDLLLKWLKWRYGPFVSEEE